MGVIEFTQNNLPKLVSEEQKRYNKEDTSISSKWKKERIPLRGTPV